jgi:sulfide dehydrogenase [flavocytochrome c] flavoprotein subunit
MQRRDFLKLIGAGAGVSAAATLAGCAGTGLSDTTGGRRVVVVGGGYGGTIAAKYIRMLDKSIEVVLVEMNDHFISCPFSNLYLGGILPDLSSITIKYDKLTANHGIKFVQAEATGVDAKGHVLQTSRGPIKYDRLILSPGIDFRTEEIAGYTAATEEKMPHSWKAGPQTILLRKQLEAMKDGGTVVLCVPLSPFRCPPGPYERTSMIAHYLKQHKPKSKIIVLDANPDIASKGGLFRKGWEKYYKGIIDYRKAAKVTAVDMNKMAVLVEGIDEVKGDVINLIPPQRAAKIAQMAGVVGEDKKWCPVNANTFESTIHKDIHVIGDSCIAGAMPKSGYSANSEAKVCATNVVALMNKREIVGLSGINTCYSYLSPDEAVSVAAVYEVQDGKIAAVKGAGGVSPDLSKTEAIYAHSWVKNILTEMST